MELFNWQLSEAEWSLHALIFALNIALLLFTRPLLGTFQDLEEHSSKLKIFLGLNVACILLHAADLLLLGIAPGYEHYFVKLGLSLAVLYGALLGCATGRTDAARRTRVHRSDFGATLCQARDHRCTGHARAGRYHDGR